MKQQINGDRYPILKNLHIDKHRPPIRVPDEVWVSELAEGIRSGRQMKPIGAEPCSSGWHVTYGYHTYLALVKIHGENSNHPVRITECAYVEKREHILDQAKDNNIKPFTDEEWKTIIEALLESGFTQTQVASKIGRSRFWIQTKLVPGKYEDRNHYPESASGKQFSSDLSPVSPTLEHEFTSPLDSSLDPEISAEAESEAVQFASPSKQPSALADSNGVDDARTGRPNESRSGVQASHPRAAGPPSFFSELQEIWKHFEAITSLSIARRLPEKEQAPFDALIQRFYFRSGDWLISAPRGEWVGENPKAKEHRIPFRIHEGDEVSVRRPWKTGIVKTLTDDGARIRYMADGKAFHEVVPYREILAKVSA